LTWVKKRITIVAKAYPEPSSKHGCVACTAGITEEGEWIRLYPVDMRHFVGDAKISKFDIIEVECKLDESDILGRRESHKIRPDTIRILDRHLTKPRVDWDARNNIVLPLLDRSIEELEVLFKEEKKSLGLVKPSRLLEFIKTEELKIQELESWSSTLTLEGERIPLVTKMNHIFKYRFQCSGCEGKKYHEMQCEDWELFESYRSWGKRYGDPETLWKNLKAKFFHEMLQKKTLYFVMGTHSRWPTWFIIGLYPPLRK